jgi:predicted TIM-barrel fold metal-dependent hydrolase
MDRILVISSDGHCGPPANEYREFLAPEHRPRFDAHQQALKDRIAAAQANVYNADNAGFVQKWESLTGGDGGLRGAHDSDYRNGMLDEEGVTGEVLFPNADVLGTGKVAASPFSDGLAAGEPEVVFAGARAHNRWLAAFVAKSPERRIGLAIVPFLDDIDAGVAEIREAHALGLRGVIIPTRWYGAPAYNDDRYEPIWSVCEELDMPMHTHAGTGPDDYAPDSRGFLGLMATEAQWWGIRPLQVLLLSGVFDRHPGLKFIPTELGNSWAEDMFFKLDRKWDGTNHNTAKFSDDNPFRRMCQAMPSSYLGTNIFIGASTPGPEDMTHRNEDINRAVMWGNDIPHPEGTYPFTKYWIRTRFHDVPEAEAVAILGENALRCYRFDADALRALAEVIGVKRDEIYGDVAMEAAPF